MSENLENLKNPNETIENIEETPLITAKKEPAQERPLYMYNPDDSYNKLDARDEPKENAAHTAYHWSMADEENALNKKKNNNKRKQKKSGKYIGLKIFAALMAIMFLIGATSAAILIASNVALRGNGENYDNKTNTLVLSNQDALDDTKNNLNGTMEDTAIIIPQDNGNSKILSTEEAIAKVKPSVVCIETETEIPDAYSRFFGGGANDKPYMHQGVGTGFIVSDDGYIATNYHVVEGAGKITVTLISGEKYDAELIGGDVFADLAIIKINGKNLPVAKLGDSDALLQGQDVVAIGTPAGIEFAGTATKGIVSAINRDVDVNGKRKMTVIQTDASINPGNSGGPLINMKGEVIGINSMKLASTQYEGMGFAIPINSAIPTFNDIIANPGIINNEQVSMAEDKSTVSFGLEGRTITEEEADYFNIPQGWKISKIAEGGACHNSGLQLSDIIVALDGVTVRSTEDLYDLKMNYKPGDKATVTIYRNGDTYDFTITLKGR